MAGGIDPDIGSGGTARVVMGRYDVTIRKMHGYLDDFRISQEALYTGATYAIPDTSTWAVGGTTVYHDDFEPLTITWVLDANSRYEISSKEHLLQVMNKGTLYTNAGTPPSNYWTSDYIQTADIDLENDSTDIIPIGQIYDYYEGEYDGGNYAISNWSYDDPGALTADTVWFVGLFGYVRYGGGIKNIKMTGVCTLDGYRDQAGMVAGTVGEAAASNIVCDFDAGSYIVGGKSGGACGGVFGYTRGSPLTGISLGGTLEMKPTDVVRGDVQHPVGGVIGNNSSPGVCDRIRNTATFPGGLQGTVVGGIMAYHHNNIGLTNCLNAMTGDIVGTSYTGGICGDLNQTTASPINTIVNSMTGNITGGSYVATGGIFGNANSTGLVLTELMNYMAGDISIPAGSTAGGMVGGGQTDMVLNNSINAMNGTVSKTVAGSVTSATVDVTIDTNFGLTYTSNGYGTTTALTGYLTDTTFTDLPYIDMSGTGADGNVYVWDFVFANLAGNPSYSDYTHLSLHKGEVSVPFYADMGLLETNTTVYLTYGNYLNEELYTDASLTVASTTAAAVYDYTKTQKMYPPLYWVLDSNSRYEISSKEHLLQLMNRGTLYIDAGTPPSTYWNSDYIQTADVDLIAHHANILPIGITDDNENSNFLASYDGGGFTISNWSYTDPSTTITGCSWYVGLFGAVTTCTLKNIRMDGVCTLDGYRDSAGFVCGAFNGVCPFYNVEVDLSDGSFMVGGKAGGNAGAISGFTNGKIMSGVTLKGTVELYGSDPVRGEGYHVMGGMFGQCGSPEIMENIRNLATFKNGITGTNTGGIWGIYAYNSNTGVCSNVTNAMRGDIVGTNAGGIFGYVVNLNGTIDATKVVNAMTGDIAGSSSAGGIVGYTAGSTVTYSNVVNYMSGDISSSRSGGMFGQINSSDTSTMTDSINAMNGTVTDSVSGSGSPVGSDVTIDTNFGMTYTTNTYGTTTALATGYLYDTTFTALPYMDMNGTDTEGNVYEWDFVFANLAGNSTYPNYTHLSLHKGDVSAPFYADMGLLETNTTVYLTYGNYLTFEMYTDGSLTVNSSTAIAVFDYSGATALYGPVVPWTQNSSSQYEISTKYHLKQLMNEGALYTDSGDAPATYWSSEYSQTADIDLLGDSTNIAPIGNDTTNFTHGYYGNGHSVSNWRCAPVTGKGGLFGKSNNFVRELRLKGTWVIEGSTSHCGFLGGFVWNVLDIEGDFDVGSSIANSGGFSAYQGAIVGETNNMWGVTVKGSIDMPDSVRWSGGVAGRSAGNAQAVRNLARFPRGITGIQNAGGVMGSCAGSVFSYVVNACVGDIAAPFAGGFAGEYTPGNVTITNCVNAMNGNITGTSGAGGFFGEYNRQYSNFKVLQSALYMTGDITCTGTASASGGIVGLFEPPTNGTVVENTVIAMNGYVYDTLYGTSDGGLPTYVAAVSQTVRTDFTFGMTSTNDQYGSSTQALTGFSTHADLPEINYFPLAVTYSTFTWDYEFPVGCLGGSATYADYTNATIHKDDMVGPYAVEYDGLSGATEYVTFSNVIKKDGYGIVYTTNLFPVLGSSAGVVYDLSGAVLFGMPPSVLNYTPGPINIRLDIDTIAGAIAYRISYQGPTGPAKTAYTGFTSLNKNIKSLATGTGYILRFYVNYGSGYDLLETETVTTLENSAENYMVNDFLGDDGKFNLNDLDDTSKSSLSEVMNELFTTGDKMTMTIGGKDENASFVKRGETANIEGSNALVMPFDSTAGSSQSVDIQLSDSTTTVTVTFDETAGTIDVASVAYSPGDFFILDGKKATVFEY